MKKILTSAFAIMIFIGVANAQSENKQSRERKQAHRQIVLKGVDLTADQKAQIETINKNYRAQMADLKSQNLPAEQLKTKRQALQQQHSGDLRALLTPEQKAKLQSSRSVKRKSTTVNPESETSRRKKDKGLTHRRRQQVSKELNLSTEQAAKMKAVNQSYKAQIEALRQNQADSRAAQKAKLENLKNDRQAAIKAILDPEQEAKIAEHRKRTRNAKK